MGAAVCRCGQALEIPSADVGYVVCPKCSAKVRIIRKPRSGPEGAVEGDGFVRFACSCGRRLKVSLADRPSHGKCPECGKIVPIPAKSYAEALNAQSETPTQEMPAADAAALEAWSKDHLARANTPQSTAEMPSEPQNRRAEAGMRVCPNCGKPIHLGADTCRGCGTAVPRR